MSVSTFGSGNGTLYSTANTPDSLTVIFQAIIAQILGYTLSITDNIAFAANPTNLPQQYYPAWNAVRVAWQPKGQPGYQQNDNVVVIRAEAIDDEYSRVRDQLQPVLSVDLPISQYDLSMGFNQTWGIHVECNGPNGYDNARLILSAITLQWVRESLQAQNLYLVVAPPRPRYVPYNFSGKFWKRADLEFRYYEQVFETLTQPTAASATITVITDEGYSDTFTVDNPPA